VQLSEVIRRVQAYLERVEAGEVKNNDKRVDLYRRLLRAHESRESVKVHEAVTALINFERRNPVGGIFRTANELAQAAFTSVRDAT
jgi:hypothetical protein